MRRSLMVSLLIGVVWCTSSVTALAATGTASPASSATPITALLEASIPVPGSPDWPITAFGSVWVLAPDLPSRQGTGTPNLVRIDPDTNDVIATIPLADRLCQGMVASDDAIWACAADGLVRIDPATNAIADVVPVELARAFYRLAFGGGKVWALGSEASVGDTIVALDPATGMLTSTPAGGPATGMTYGFDALWLALPRSGSVIRLDPETGETTELVTGLPSPTQIVAGADSLWVTLHGGQEDEARPGDPQVARIDPATGDVIATFSIGGSPRGGVDVLAGEDAIWVRGTRPWLARIDPDTNLVVETFGSEPSINAVPGPLAEGFGSLWTVNIEEDAVYRLTPP
ncbi:MAG: hypothetical protein ABWZ82_11480 [Candidatus Limnocylindrales bacterium]